jgi:hypothetical protein
MTPLQKGYSSKIEKSREFMQQVAAQKSYTDVLNLISKYVNIL